MDCYELQANQGKPEHYSYSVSEKKIDNIVKIFIFHSQFFDYKYKTRFDSGYKSFEILISPVWLPLSTPVINIWYMGKDGVLV